MPLRGPYSGRFAPAAEPTGIAAPAPGAQAAHDQEPHQGVAGLGSSSSAHAQPGHLSAEDMSQPAFPPQEPGADETLTPLAELTTALTFSDVDTQETMVNKGLGTAGDMLFQKTKEGTQLFKDRVFIRKLLFSVAQCAPTDLRAGHALVSRACAIWYRQQVSTWTLCQTCTSQGAPPMCI